MDIDSFLRVYIYQTFPRVTADTSCAVCPTDNGKKVGTGTGYKKGHARDAAATLALKELLPPQPVAAPAPPPSSYPTAKPTMAAPQSMASPRQPGDYRNGMRLADGPMIPSGYVRPFTHFR